MFVKRDLRERVVVITGASSGIGRATAIAFGKAGAHVVLAARSVDALEETARLVEENDRGTALVVPTDVTIEADAQALVRAAMEQYGRIDVWVNNAAITLFARIEEAPVEAHLRVIETNLFGPIYCTRAVLPVFRGQATGRSSTSARSSARSVSRTCRRTR
jgi:NAD(P)-dependent dehydrogenase (short-subunit alcohol dehydrogenase family)